MQALNRNRPTILGRFATVAAVGVYLLAIVEFAVMSSPFAAYYYNAYSPLLAFLHKTPHLSWLSALYLTHLSESSSGLLNSLKTLGVALTWLGVILFLVHAAYLYWTKYVTKGVAGRLLYAYVRHPQYLSFMIAGVGVAIWWPRFINLILLFPMVAVYYALARHEERRMELKHGEAYRAYAAGKAMFFPGSPGRRLTNAVFGRLPAGVTRSAAAFVAVLLLAVGGAFGLRSYGVRHLRLHVPSDAPDTLVVAVNPPGSVELAALASQTIESLRSKPDPSIHDDSIRVLYLIWEFKKLRHFLVDGGIKHDVLIDADVPEADFYVVVARASGSSSRRVTQDSDPTDALSATVIRRFEGLYYRPTDVGQFTLEGFDLPAHALHTHTCLPAL